MKLIKGDPNKPLTIRYFPTGSIEISTSQELLILHTKLVKQLDEYQYIALIEDMAK